VIKLNAFFRRCDNHLMARVFHPIAWYVDARWHKNQFFLAIICISLAMLVLGAQCLWDVIFARGWVKLIVVPCVAVNIFLYQGWLNRFIAASKWQEDHPGQLAWPHHSFCVYPGELRFAQLLFCSFILAILMPVAIATRDFGAACPGLWLLLIGFGMCFAGVLPPDPGARREKKEKALTWFTPAPSLAP
jgi:hypothetical protein